MAEPASIAVDEDQRFLTFWMNDRLYALPAAEVSEVIREPAVSRMPQSPKSLTGLANLRGAVIPVVSLRKLLGAQAAEQIEQRSILLGHNAPVALSVDRIAALVTIGSDEVQEEEAELAAVPGEHLRGVFKAPGGEHVAKILDIRAMLSAAFIQPAAAVHRANAPSPTAPLRQAQSRRAARQLVTFDINGQEFALPLADVTEIIETPATVASIPRAEALVLGVTSYRDRLLPLFSLRVLLGFDAREHSGDGAVVVASIGGRLVGLAVDHMRAIVNAEENLIEPPPPVLISRAGGEAQIEAIYRGEGGARLISILAAQSLFREDVMQRLTTNTPASPAAAKASRAEDLRFLIFQLGDIEFALPIDTVIEVARAPERVTKMPKTPDFLEGVVNLRGEVLPVIDQRRRFDMPKLENAPSQRLIVVRSERHRAGLIVDSVSDVLRCPADLLGPAPAMAGEATRLVSAVINHETRERLIMVLDPDEVLSRAERGLLDAFEADAGAGAA